MARRQMRRERRQAGELERGQIFALQMLDEVRAVAAEIGADEPARLLEADHGFRDAKRATQLRGGDERLGEYDLQPRAAQHAFPALFGAERVKAEIPGMLQRVRAAAAEHLPRER